MVSVCGVKMSRILGHADWLTTILGSPTKKTLRIMDPSVQDNSLQSIDISIVENVSGDSSSEEMGWLVDVVYTNTPDTILFTNVYQDEQTAKKVFDDLVLVAAEADGAIRQEDFEKAQEQTEALKKKFLANSQEPTI